MAFREEFSEVYKIQCRSTWYALGCPSPTKMEQRKLIPADENGRTANFRMIEKWMFDNAWTQWADVITAEISVQAEKDLINDKVELIKEQLEQTRVVRNNAYASIKEGKFDSSASAVNAFFKASEAERGLMQIEKVIEDLANSETADLQKQFRELAERAGSTIDAEVVEEKEDE